MGKFCTNCGQSIEEGMNNCPNCGTATVKKENKNINNNVNEQPKSKIAAGMLGIFLGYFGVHNFYLGYTGKAVAQLLITLLSCFVLAPVSSIWGLIEGIMILAGSINVDAKGNPLGE